MIGQRGRRLLVAGVAAAGALAVLGVLTAGPLPAGPPRWRDAGPAVWPTMPPQPESSSTLPPVSVPPAAGAVLRTITAVLFALAVLALLTVVALLVVRLIRNRRRRVRRAAAVASGTGAAAVLDAQAIAPAVRRGIARALAELDDARDANDAIVQAWLWLEDAARQAGAPRTPSETPAEYAVRIVRRFEANRAAADILLRLYQDVRFGGRTADAATVRTARECLEHLERSWHAPAEPAGSGT
ncbi:DUF4129 domain-containing protein [Microbacterium luticocti]|uniref:DUF4129 domain-containing protein n=1 Tax=Microbacterium luticocti TaxID=451764 RepID=UPI00048FCBC8|nr:DUF4129 domain-containing protein [Microbacterium luticocti]